MSEGLSYGGSPGQDVAFDGTFLVLDTAFKR